MQKIDSQPMVRLESLRLGDDFDLRIVMCEVYRGDDKDADLRIVRCELVMRMKERLI